MLQNISIKIGSGRVVTNPFLSAKIVWFFNCKYHNKFKELNSNSNKKTLSPSEIKKKLEFYCSYQERCHNEVTQKLKLLEANSDEIDEIIVHLIQNNFLNEERFATSFARGKHTIKHWGKIRIVNELRFRNITKYNIDKGLKEISALDYAKNFNILAERTWENCKESNVLKRKKKVADSLFRKGYESNLVFEFLQNY